MVSSKDFFPGCSENKQQPLETTHHPQTQGGACTRENKKLWEASLYRVTGKERMQQHSLKPSQKGKLCKPLKLFKDLLLEIGNIIKIAFSDKERYAQLQTFTCCKAISSCSILWDKKNIFVCCYLLHYDLTQQAAPQSHSLTPQWNGRGNQKSKGRKLVGWDKDVLIGKAKPKGTSQGKTNNSFTTCHG